MTEQVETENVYFEYYPTYDIGEILWQGQCKDKSLGTLETTNLVEMNNFELVPEEHGKKKYTQKWENDQLFYINKYHKQQEYVGYCRQM